MANKVINARMISRHDTESNWNKVNFIPEKGEIVIYDPDSDNNNSRIKIGNGLSRITNLDFFGSNLVLKQDNKGLSTNDFTNEYKNKLDTFNFFKLAKDDNGFFINGLAENNNNLINTGILNLRLENDLNNTDKKYLYFQQLDKDFAIVENKIAFGDLAFKDTQQLFTSLILELDEDKGSLLLKYENNTDNARRCDIHSVMAFNSTAEWWSNNTDEKLILPDYVKVVHHNNRLYEHTIKDDEHIYKPFINEVHFVEIPESSSNGIKDIFIPDFVKIIFAYDHKQNKIITYYRDDYIYTDSNGEIAYEKRYLQMNEFTIPAIGDE